PLVDRHYYKHVIVRGLAARDGDVEDVVVVYAHSTLPALLRLARRQTPGAGWALMRRVASPPLRTNITEASMAPTPTGRVDRNARAHGFSVAKFPGDADPACTDFVRSFRPDVVFNLPRL